MRIRDWMTKTVVSVKPKDTIQHARELLETHRIRQLPVVVNGRVVGIITDRDLRDVYPSVLDDEIHLEHHHKKWSDPDKVTVETVMTCDVITVEPDDDLIKAARHMSTERIGAIPVVENDVMVGIIARADLLQAFVALSIERPGHAKAS